TARLLWPPPAALRPRRPGPPVGWPPAPASPPDPAPAPDSPDLVILARHTPQEPPHTPPREPANPQDLFPGHGGPDPQTHAPRPAPAPRLRRTRTGPPRGDGPGQPSRLGRASAGQATGPGSVPSPRHREPVRRRRLADRGRRRASDHALAKAAVRGRTRHRLP